MHCSRAASVGVAGELLMDLLKSMPEGTVGATWPTFYKPEAFVLLLYVTAIGTNLNWIFGQIS